MAGGRKLGKDSGGFYPACVVTTAATRGGRRGLGGVSFRFPIVDLPEGGPEFAEIPRVKVGIASDDGAEAFPVAPIVHKSRSLRVVSDVEAGIDEGVGIPFRFVEHVVVGLGL